MNHLPFSRAVQRSRILPGATIALGAVIFAADIFTPPDCVVSGLYVVIVLMAGGVLRGRRLWLITLACGVSTITAQILANRLTLGNDQIAYIGAFNTSVSLLAIILATWLVLQSQAVEAAMRSAQSELARSSRITTMGELTASIAHEVNQPIAGVVANANACSRWLAGNPPDLLEARAAAGRIVRDGTRAADIISRIRQLFAKSSVQREATDVNQLIRETTELLRTQATHHATVVRMDLASEIPSIAADRVQLQQVLVNLVVNAIESVKAMPHSREVVLKSSQPDNYHVAVSVSDNGVGLPPDHANSIFATFFTTKAGGTGMGLSISRSIVEAHDGHIRATPNRPSGATFTFTLPIGEASSEQLPARDSYTKV
jgi:C4-dicarboxylate-specific signal transduction histidine kinase